MIHCAAHLAKKWTLALLLMLPAIPSTIWATSAQDSLWLAWRNSALPDTNRLDALDECIWQKYLFSKPDSAYYLTKQGEAYAKQAGELSWVGHFISLRSIALNLQGLSEEAYATANEALARFEMVRDTSGILMIKTNMSKIQLDQGNYVRALELALETLPRFIEIADSEGICLSYGRIANIHSALGDLEEAESYFQKSYPYCNQDHLAQHQRDLAAAYREAGRYNEAETLLNRLRQDTTHDLRFLAHLERQQGLLAQHAGRTEDARRHLETSLDHAMKIKNRRGVLETNILLGQFELSQGFAERGKSACLQASEIAIDLDHDEFRLESCRCLANAAEMLGDEKLQLKCQKDITRLQDRLMQRHDREAVAKLMLQRDYKAEAQQRLLQEQEDKLVLATSQKDQRLLTLVLIAGLLAALTIAFLLYQRNRIQQTAETVLAGKNLQLHEQKEELQSYIDRNIKLKEFAKVASHDLRTPIQTISNFSTLLEHRSGDRLTKDEKSYLDLIKSGSLQMMNLVDGLLMYAESESDTPIRQEISPMQIVEQTVTNFKSALLPDDRIEIGSLPPIILGDRIRLEQIFQNLIGNALKFRGDRPAHIKIAGSEGPEAWHFRVADNGLGINPDYQEKIFQEYERLHTKDEIPGSGLGLSIAKRIVEQHGGKIRVKSKPGEGSVFSFSIAKIPQQMRPAITPN